MSMADARLESQWAQTSQALALLYANVRMKLKNPPKAMSANDFNPYAKKEKPIPVDITALKALVGQKRKPK